MKKIYLLPSPNSKLVCAVLCVALAAAGLSAQNVLTFDDSGADQFRTQVSDPFGTPTYVTGGVAKSLGWLNNLTNATWNSVMRFDTANTPGFATDLSNLAGQSVEFSFTMPALPDGQTASLYYRAYNNVDSGTQFGYAVPGQGSLLATGLSGDGLLTFDVTASLGAQADGVERLFVYFTLVIDGPTSNPGSGSSVVDMDWSGATLTIITDNTLLLFNNSGSDQFRTQVSDPFGTPTYVTGGVAKSLGWLNNLTNATWNSVMRFTLANTPGFAADLADLTGQSVTFSFTMPTLPDGQTASLYFRGYNNVNSGTQFGYGIPNTGTLLAVGLSGNGLVSYDVTAALAAVTTGVEKAYLYFTLVIDGPTLNPMTGASVIDMNWAGAVLDIEEAATPNPAPAIVIGLGGADQLDVSFESISGASYQLEKSTDGMASWTDVGSPAAGTGALMVLSDPTGKPSAGNNVFYRVTVAP